MIGTGIVMRFDSIGNRGFIAPRHDRIDKTIRSPIGDICIGESEALQVVRVVGQSEVAQTIAALEDCLLTALTYRERVVLSSSALHAESGRIGVWEN